MVKAETYSLRQVVELTGLSEFTLRGWELRYGAFSPRRSGTGRRQYSATDLKRALLLRELTKRQHRIGDVAKLPLAKLDGLLEAGAPPPSEVPAGFEKSVTRALKLASLQEWDDLEKSLCSVTAKNEPLPALRGFFLPLLRSLSEEVSHGRITISQEHVVSALVKTQLYRLHEKAKAPTGNTRLIIAAPEGDYHELGILSAHVLAAHYRVRSLYLGPNTPKNELAETALRYGATHLILGSTLSRAEGAKEDLYTLLHHLDRHLPQGLTLWLGGRHGTEFRGQLERKFAVFSSLHSLEEALKEIS